jgi:hypothetical protein
VRVEQDQPSFAEWFEWLGDQPDKRKTRTEPAHILRCNWKP